MSHLAFYCSVGDDISQIDAGSINFLSKVTSIKTIAD